MAPFSALLAPRGRPVICRTTDVRAAATPPSHARLGVPQQTQSLLQCADLLCHVLHVAAYFCRTNPPILDQSRDNVHRLTFRQFRRRAALPCAHFLVFRSVSDVLTIPERSSEVRQRFPTCLPTSICQDASRSRFRDPAGWNLQAIPHRARPRLPASRSWRAHGGGSRAVWAIDGDTAFATTRIGADQTTHIGERQRGDAVLLGAVGDHRAHAVAQRGTGEGEAEARIA